MISLSRLEGFYWVAKTGGYARAARAFPWPITQPGVHQQVRRLEQQLAVTLFERTGKDSVALTSAGQALFQAVAPFYEALPALEAAIQGGTLGGTLRIHAAGHVLKHFLPPWLRALQRARPDIEVALQGEEADLELLRRSEADLLVDRRPTYLAQNEAKSIPFGWWRELSISKPMASDSYPLSAASTQSRPAFVYGGGSDYALSKGISLRLEYRGLVYLAPDMGFSSVSTGIVTHSAQPSAGLSSQNF